MIKKTPLKAIRAKCLDCCVGSSKEVKLCPSSNCPLHIYRFGKMPKKSATLLKENSEKQLLDRKETA